MAFRKKGVIEETIVLELPRAAVRTYKALASLFGIHQEEPSRRMLLFLVFLDSRTEGERNFSSAVLRDRAEQGRGLGLRSHLAEMR